MKSTLRNLITSKCPELLELKFGCQFFYEKQWRNDILTFCSIYDDIDNTKTLSFLSGDKEMTWEINSFYSPEINGIEILGTPPSWSDYLRCLGEDYAIDGGGNIWKYVKEYKAWLSHSFEDTTEFPVVDLTKSPLEQTDEIIEKLVDLISNK